MRRIHGAVAVLLLAAACGRDPAPHFDDSACASLPTRAEAFAAFEAAVGGTDEATLLFEEGALGQRLAGLVAHLPDEGDVARLFRTREALEGEPAWPQLAASPDIAAAIDLDAFDWENEHLLLHRGWAAEDRYLYQIDGDTLVVRVGRAAPCVAEADAARMRDWARTVRALRIPAVALVRFDVQVVPYRVPRVRASGKCTRDPAAPLFRTKGMTGAIARVEDGYRLWLEAYSAMSGNWFLSKSRDGIAWTPAGWDEDFLCTFENHGRYADHYGVSVLPAEGGGWMAWYAERTEFAGPLDVIARSFSADGLAFSDGEVVLRPGPPGRWDDTSVAAPSVLAHGGRLWLWYEGESTDRVPRIGLAFSDDGGATWTRHEAPVLEPGPPGSFDELGVGGPEVRHDGARFHLWYEASAGGGNPLVPWRASIGHAVSEDGITWVKDEAPVLVPARKFEDFQLRAPAVSIEDGGYRLWYAGIAGGEPSVGLARCTF